MDKAPPDKLPRKTFSSFTAGKYITDSAFRHNRTQIVRFLKILLPAIAILILLFLFYRMGEQAKTAPANSQARDNRIEMTGAEYESYDAENRPYTITAKKVSRSLSDEDRIFLENPVADIVLNKNGWIAAKAEKGLYNREKGHLQLSGDVELFHDDGYTVKTSEMDLYLTQGYAISDKAVTGHGPAGQITAAGMEIREGGKKIIFKNNVKMILRTDEPGEKN